MLGLGPRTHRSSSLLSQSLRGCEAGDRRDADTCPERLHEGTGGAHTLAPGRGGRGPGAISEHGFGNWGWSSGSDEKHLQSLKAWPSGLQGVGMAPEQWRRTRSHTLNWQIQCLRRRSDTEVTGPAACLRGAHCPVGHGQGGHEVTKRLGLHPGAQGARAPAPSHGMFVRTGGRPPCQGPGCCYCLSFRGLGRVPLFIPQPIHCRHPWAMGRQGKGPLKGRDQAGVGRPFMEQS